MAHLEHSTDRGKQFPNLGAAEGVGQTAKAGLLHGRSVRGVDDFGRLTGSRIQIACQSASA